MPCLSQAAQTHILLYYYSKFFLNIQTTNMRTQPHPDSPQDWEHFGHFANGTDLVSDDLLTGSRSISWEEPGNKLIFHKQHTGAEYSIEELIRCQRFLFLKLQSVNMSTVCLQNNLLKYPQLTGNAKNCIWSYSTFKIRCNSFISFDLFVSENLRWKSWGMCRPHHQRSHLHRS